MHSDWRDLVAWWLALDDYSKGISIGAALATAVLLTLLYTIDALRRALKDTRE